MFHSSVLQVGKDSRRTRWCIACGSVPSQRAAGPHVRGRAVGFCSPPACSTVCLAELLVVAARPSPWEALQLLPLRDHPLLLWPTCLPLMLFVLPALCSHTGGPSCRHLEASSWFRALPALLCLPRGRGDMLVLGKLSVPANGHGVGGLRALEPAWHEERTLSSLLAEGLCS